jgi:predicted peptidase
MIFIRKNMIKFFNALLILLFTTSSSTIAHQTAHKATVGNHSEVQYLLYLPADYYQNTGKQYPILLFLHGGGETGTDIEKVKTHGPPRLINEGHNFPFIVLSPQNPREQGFWDESILMGLLDKIENTHRIDPARVYLSGMSRGAYGAWRLAMSYPEKFACLIAICGVAPAYYSRWLGNMPVWVFHGDDDPVIPVSESDEVVKLMKERGQNIRYTRYSGTGHDAWTPAFETEELYHWMLEQVKKP